MCKAGAPVICAPPFEDDMTRQTFKNALPVDVAYRGERLDACGWRDGD
jgi:hypothetical protein